MRKTPLSAPGGSYGRKNNYDRNYRDRRYGFDDRSGYGNMQNDDDNNKVNFSPGQTQPSPQKTSGDDFIPLGFSSPVNHRPRYNSMNNSWRGGGGGQGNSQGYRHRGTPPYSPGNGGFNNSFRHNFHHHDTPKSTFNDFNSQRFHRKQHDGQWRPRPKDAHRRVDVSNYLNVKSTLEDPWADLMRNLERRNLAKEAKIETGDVSTSGSIPGEDLNPASKDPNSKSPSTETQITADEETKNTTTTLIAESS